MAPAEDNNNTHASQTDGPTLRVLTARWELPAGGPDGPKRSLLIDLAFRLAAIMQPGFAPSRTPQPISNNSELDETSGASSQTKVSRLGDAERGVEVTDGFFNPNDGIVGISGWTGVTVYCLPDGWDLHLEGDFVAAQYGRPHTMTVKATLPEEMANTIANIMKAEFGATVEES